jgi:hypothetical protein
MASVGMGNFSVHQAWQCVCNLPKEMRELSSGNEIYLIQLPVKFQGLHKNSHQDMKFA